MRGVLWQSRRVVAKTMGRGETQPSLATKVYLASSPLLQHSESRSTGEIQSLRCSISKLTEFFALVRCHTSSRLGSNCASSTDLIDANASAARLKRGSPTKLSPTSRSDRQASSWTLSFVLSEGFGEYFRVPSGGGGVRLEQRDMLHKNKDWLYSRTPSRTIIKFKTSFDLPSSRTPSTSSFIFLSRDMP